MLNLKQGFNLIPMEVKGVVIQTTYVVLTFLIGVILARSLGPDAYGRYSYLISWVVLSVSFVTAGLPILLVREISVFNQNEQFSFIKGIFYYSYFLVALFFSFIVVGMLIINNFEIINLWVILLSLVAVLFLPLLAIYEAGLRGFGHVLLGQLTSKVISPFLSLMLISLLISYSGFEKISFINALYVFSLVSIFGAIIAFLVFRRKVNESFCLGREYQLEKWNSSFWKISLVGWLGALNIQLSFILLGYFGNDFDVAQYKVAGQIASLIPFGLVVINAIQMPALSKAFEKGSNEELQRLANRSCITSTLLGAPVIFIILFFGERLVVGLFGVEYLIASDVLLILAIGQIINVSVGSTGILMLASRNEQIVMINLGLVLLLNIGFCIILIPVLGALGAAIASTIALIIRNLFLVFYLYRNMGIVSLPRVWRDY